MAYTPFSLLAASLMVTMAFGSSSVDTEPIETSYSNTVVESWGETQANYAVDSLSEYVGLYSGNKTPTEIDQALINLTRHGTYQSKRERTSTYINWTKKTESQTAKITQTNISNLNIEIENVSIKTKANLQINTRGKTVERSLTSSKYIKNVEDPLIDNTPYSRKIGYCGFNSLASKLIDNSEAERTQGKIRGKAIVKPQSLPTNSRDSKIIVTENISKYAERNVTNFAGYYSQHRPPYPESSEDYNNNFVVGTDSMPKISTEDRAIIKNGFWKSNFHKAISQDCYIPSSLEETPSMYDRINESARGDTNEGMYTVLNPQSGESDIGYERLDNSSLNIVGIETVSKSGAWPDFNMSGSLADSEGLSELTK